MISRRVRILLLLMAIIFVMGIGLVIFYLPVNETPMVDSHNLLLQENRTAMFHIRETETSAPMTEMVRQTRVVTEMP